ncbi:MAG: hypothetical protein Q9198_008683 [Flavoplaca austrocitrina]
MPETIVQVSSSSALKEAVNHVTKNGMLEWRFAGWTTNNNAMWNGKPVFTGMRGIRRHYTKGWQNFTIRHDYDFLRGEQQAGGKGYHVNVELPQEKLAFVKWTGGGHNYARDCWKTMSEMIENCGEKAAVDWFMQLQPNPLG